MPAQMSFTQWQNIPPFAAPVAVSYGPEPVFRDGLDQTRSMYNRVPQAEYPDGYLGTISSRRTDDDKLLEAIPRLNQKQYQRGVHKGERIDPQDYVWPGAFNDESGIARQERGNEFGSRRFAPTMTLNERLVADDQLPLPPGAIGIVSLDRNRVEQLRRLAPGWS